MRGSDGRSGALFSYVALEDRVPAGLPLRAIREIVNSALGGLSADFAGLYSRTGQPSIPPEKLLRALLLQAFYSIRSERQLMEQLDFNLLYRWLVGLGIDDAAWNATTFCKNRDRLLKGEVARRFLEEVVDHARVRGLLSDDHFSVDGTLIEAWASAKSLRPRDEIDADDGPPSSAGRNAERNFRGENRSNETHVSTTDPDARLSHKGIGKEAKLCHAGQRRSRIDGRMTHHPGYAASQRARKLIEEIFGWVKTVGGLRKTRHHGTDRVGWMFSLTVAAYKLTRIPRLVAATP